MSGAISFACPACRAPIAKSHEDLLVCADCGRRLERKSGVWSADARHRPEGFSKERRDHLIALERDHFWFEPRRRLVAGRLPRARAAHALELGCGTGRMLPTLAAAADHVVAVDGHPELLAEARRRAPSVELVHGPVDSLPFDDAQFELVVALDVLEHVDPDALLAEARRVCTPGGVLLLTVPSMPSLYGPADEAAGHRCRYDRATLERELARNGWEPVAFTHYQFALLPAMIASRWLGKGRKASDFERQPPRWLNRSLEFVNHIEVGFSRQFALPWGSSLLMSARPVPHASENDYAPRDRGARESIRGDEG